MCGSALQCGAHAPQSPSQPIPDSGRSLSGTRRERRMPPGGLILDERLAVMSMLMIVLEGGGLRQGGGVHRKHETYVV
ncbi:hypothetical protein C8Q74DRAFT_1248210 [Fomes fomentarius]|nr:hypothetical protein C8Q74DRAFT_1248210 [Fomes fomentarius]